MIVFTVILIKLELRFVIDVKCFTSLVCFLKESILFLNVSTVASYYTFCGGFSILIPLFCLKFFVANLSKTSFELQLLLNHSIHFFLSGVFCYPPWFVFFYGVLV